jgi:cytochrome c553
MHSPFASTDRRRAVSFCTWVLALGLTWPATAQDDAEETDSPYRPGLVASYSLAGTTATRIDESIAFDWDAAPPDSLLPAGRFTATWRGRLLTQAAGRYEFKAFAAGGKVAIKLADKELISAEAAEPQWLAAESTDLTFGFQPLEVTFEKTGEHAQLALFWSGPNFVLEPIPERFLFHDREASPSTDFERGRRLAAALRCGACHKDGDAASPLPAPALDRLSGNLHPAWLIDWLTSRAGEASREGEAPAEPPLVRRMPHFDLSKSEAADIAAWLLRQPAEKQPSEKPEPKAAKSAKGGKGKDSPPKPSADEGQRLFLTLGCLACHQHGELGESGLFSGGELSAIAAKRPAAYFERWLADPASLNRQHRMPVFDLSVAERQSLALWLAGQGAAADPAALGTVERGAKLIAQHRCGSCHTLPGAADSPQTASLKALAAASDWSRSCAAASDAQATRPGFGLAAADRAALKTYFTLRAAVDQKSPTSGRDLLVELNCLACHAREGIDRRTHALPARLQDKLNAVVSLHDDLGKLVPAMTPPALNSVGDKLTDAALAAAIRRQDKPHRPYLMVRMPKYNLSDEQLRALTNYFTTTDRIPSREGEAPAEPQSRPLVAALQAAGPRLVTTDGFGCTSCHQVGSVLPDKAPLNARGPNLSMLEKRIRPEWFRRWCNSPARIVPRMEMPSVQIPVRGVLGDKIDDQLAAVWHILNTPGFEPPEPNPVRVLRLSGVPERKESPIVLHDVIKAGDKTYLFPLVIGLPNRHNILFDLETNRLAAWWLGDTARQRTKGKSWYWEAGGEAMPLDSGRDLDPALIIGNKELRPEPVGQFGSSLSNWSVAPDRPRVTISRFLYFKVDGKRTPVHSLEIIEPEGSAGFARRLRFFEVPARKIRLQLVDPQQAAKARWDEGARVVHLADGRSIELRAEGAPVEWQSDGSVTIGPKKFGRVPEPDDPNFGVRLVYRASGPSDQFLTAPVEAAPAVAGPVAIAPGFAGQRLALPVDIMPVGLTWDPSGRLAFASLKGQVCRVDERDKTAPMVQVLADGLPTPYGIAARGKDIHVITKSALMAIEDSLNNRGSSTSILAAGWGVTDDYHDWAVGLIQGDQGEYYIGLPCQQDQRSEAAAKHRGQVLMLVPKKRSSPANPWAFDIDVVSSGHRFPMGLARNRDGELFVTDNQGNYNPFNELNHVRPGAHFGFINALEKDKGLKPPRHDKPAIDIPHPWTRSVNGICFLDTPQELWQGPGTGIFGPLEGHLVGCEYDTRALIRMTLQKVGDTYQGAAYPLSIPPENVEDGLLGPIVCAVSPRGELYVGDIRDSGWGAGNNVGDIVQIKIEPDKLPCGIAEVRATKEGFTLDFFRPVDPAKAKDAANYNIASYRRESTPAYGGPNLDRRSEKVAALELAPDAKRVTLKLADLRPGFLYEFQLRPLVRGKELFHPAEAHYTLNQIP